jgi:ligand-binding SRPBCC domain-containing protein
LYLTRKEYHQDLPISLQQAWEFFSTPNNLNVITPKEMNFKILSGADIPMHPGLIIQYTVTPLMGIPMDWVTEITHVQPLQFFVDEQRFGPYSLWHHQHRFEATDFGVKMTDILHYKVPFGPVGKLINALFISKKVDSIFEYRTKVLNKMFPKV